MSFLQSVFMVLLPTFILNYYIMRKAGVLPYIKDTHENTLSKALGVLQMLAIISAVYSYQSSARGTLIILAVAAILLFVLHSLVYGKDSKLTVVGGVLAMLGGILLQTRLEMASGYPQRNNDTVVAVIAVLAQAWVCQTMGSLRTSCIVTTIHQILLINLIFIPMFF